MRNQNKQTELLERIANKLAPIENPSYMSFNTSNISAADDDATNSARATMLQELLKKKREGLISEDDFSKEQDKISSGSDGEIA